MIRFSLYSEEQNNTPSTIVFPTPTNAVKSSNIKEGMTPKEIANIISDHLISFVDKAFEEKKFQSNVKAAP